MTTRQHDDGGDPDTMINAYLESLELEKEEKQEADPPAPSPKTNKTVGGAAADPKVKARSDECPERGCDGQLEEKAGITRCNKCGSRHCQTCSQIYVPDRGAKSRSKFCDSCRAGKMGASALPPKDAPAPTEAKEVAKVTKAPCPEEGCSGTLEFIEQLALVACSNPACRHVPKQECQRCGKGTIQPSSSVKDKDGNQVICCDQQDEDDECDGVVCTGCHRYFYTSNGASRNYKCDICKAADRCENCGTTHVGCCLKKSGGPGADEEKADEKAAPATSAEPPAGPKKDGETVHLIETILAVDVNGLDSIADCKEWLTVIKAIFVIAKKEGRALPRETRESLAQLKVLIDRKKKQLEKSAVAPASTIISLRRPILEPEEKAAGNEAEKPKESFWRGFLPW